MKQIVILTPPGESSIRYTDGIDVFSRLLKKFAERDYIHRVDFVTIETDRITIGLEVEKPLNDKHIQQNFSISLCHEHGWRITDVKDDRVFTTAFIPDT